MPQEFSHRVVAIVTAESNPFEMGVATELFGLRRPELNRPWYDFTLCAATPDVRMNLGMFTLSGVAGLEAADTADTLIAPTRPDTGVPTDPAIIAAIRRAADRGARLVSFCTGAFALAEAGVLDGRRATTHWRWAAEFAERFPAVRWEPDVLFVDEGDVLTAAGSAASLDLGLHLIHRDHGAEVVNAVSRRLVFTGHRDGGQRQFIARPVPHGAGHLAGTAAGLGPRTAGHPADGGRPGRTGGDQPGDAAPEVPRGTGNDAAGVADDRAGDAGLPPDRTRRTTAGPGSRGKRFRHGGEPAAAAETPHGSQPERLPPPLRPGPREW